MFGVQYNSPKQCVFGDEVACVIRSAAARGEFADEERRIYGSRAERARCCGGSMIVDETDSRGYLCRLGGR